MLWVHCIEFQLLDIYNGEGKQAITETGRCKVEIGPPLKIDPGSDEIHELCDLLCWNVMDYICMYDLGPYWSSNSSNFQPSVRVSSCCI